jgi:hypothetical protein
MLVRFTYVVAAVIALAVGHGSSQRRPPHRPNCPNHEEFRPRSINGTLQTNVIIPHVGPATNIAEFNDCQALVVGNEYGPLVGIFPNQDYVPVSSRSQYYLVAVIFNYGSFADPSVPYAPLFIRPGFSCLYLSLGSRIIAGHMKSNGKDSNCPASIPVVDKPNLEARVMPKNPGHVVPRAAKWDWDRQRGEHYIGVACGVEWCEVGRKRFTSSPDPDISWVATVPGLTVSAVHRVRGYFDEQELSVDPPSAEPTKPLALSGSRATFFPAPKLAGESNRTSLYVGTMIIDKTHPKYEKRFGLVAGKPTHIYVERRRTAGGAPLPAYADGTEDYEAVFITSGSPAIRMGFKRRPHPGANIPPVARWRWLWEDETTWIRCLEGCCSTD